jgi:hypothetical protein
MSQLKSTTYDKSRAELAVHIIATALAARMLYPSAHAAWREGHQYGVCESLAIVLGVRRDIPHYVWSDHDATSRADAELAQRLVKVLDLQELLDYDVATYIMLLASKLAK